MMDPAQTIRVEVVYALPERAWRVLRVLPGDATVAMAVAAAMAELQAAGLPISESSVSGLVSSLVSGLPSSELQLAIFGRVVEPHTPLQDGDRVELLRPLLADPKQARRQRAKEQPVREQPVRDQLTRDRPTK